MAASFMVQNGMLVIEDEQWGGSVELNRAELLELMEFVQRTDLEELS